MRIVHFYGVTTGHLSRFVYRTSSPKADELIAANTPVGHRPIEGVTDRDSQRVDTRSGRIISDPDLSQKSQNAKLGTRRKREARHEIEALEKLQVRSITELMDDPSNPVARLNFNRRRKRIDELRNELVIAPRGVR